MRKAKNPTERALDPYDEQRLAKAERRVDDVRTYRRIQAVLLVARGRAVPEVAEIAGVWPWAVYD